MMHNILQLAEHRRILLLQSPIGTFFYELAHWLTQQHQATVFKINFNGGDELFYPTHSPNTFDFTDDYHHFHDYLFHFIIQNRIDAVVCFGDTRLYHQAAKHICQRQNIAFWVFEEGYFRPNFVTLEKIGVNAYSPLPRHADFFQADQKRDFIFETPLPPSKFRFIKIAKQAMAYYRAMYFSRQKFPYYQHHRESSISYYIRIWTKSFVRRLIYTLTEYRFARQLAQKKIGKFFILPLQVNTDSQIRIHSDYATMQDCLLHVLSSFAIYAPPDTHLIVKHHPMDRGLTQYRRIIHQFVHRHPNVKGRIFYVHDVSLPEMLRQGIGMITVNSTSGLSALIHGMPVKCLGDCPYDMVGITSQQKLNEFWQLPEKPQRELFQAYREYHLQQTQLLGNFHTGVFLPKKSVSGS